MVLSKVWRSSLRFLHEINMLTCKICHKQFKHLGSHIWHKHKILAREYKERFGLPYNMGLITEEIREKKRRTATWQKTWKKNFKNSKKYQFRKGHSGHRRISRYERKQIIKRIKSVNSENAKFFQCPVCKMKFHHLESHLYNKHKLLKVE